MSNLEKINTQKTVPSYRKVSLKKKGEKRNFVCEHNLKKKKKN